MDAGLAAVCGALAGSVATVGVGLATVWAQREVARIAARAEHLRQRREPRHDVYREFIAAASEMKQVTLFIRHRATGPSHMAEDAVDRFKRIAAEVNSKRMAVDLAGPKSVAHAAYMVDAMCALIARNADFLFYAAQSAPGFSAEDPGVQEYVTIIKQEIDNLPAALQEFVDRAQAALDADGSGKPIT